MYDHKKHLRERRDRWKSAGVCVTCGNEKERDDITLCDVCNQRNKDWRLSRVYGITRDEYEQLRVSQGQKCAICHEPLELSGRNVHIDHDHETGKARGVLCRQCNVWLGTYEKFLALGLIPKFDQYLENR